MRLVDMEYTELTRENIQKVHDEMEEEAFIVQLTVAFTTKSQLKNLLQSAWDTLSQLAADDADVTPEETEIVGEVERITNV